MSGEKSQKTPAVKKRYSTTGLDPLRKDIQEVFVDPNSKHFTMVLLFFKVGVTICNKTP